MKIAVIGRGNVGRSLGEGFSRAGHEVRYGSRSPKAADEGLLSEVVAFADVVVLSIPLSGVAETLSDSSLFASTVVIDCTNPINTDFSGLDASVVPSGGEWVASLIPGAKVVKVFNSVGYEVMVDPSFGDQRASMLYAGDDVEAKHLAAQLVSDLGFDAVDAGPLSQSAYLEALAWLWISMAFKFGHGRGMAFCLLKR